MKNIKQKIYFIGVLLLFCTGIISCEKDFTDIGTTIVSNTKFSTGDTIIEVVITPKKVERVRADGLALGGLQNQYLLGVYNNPNYQKIAASIVSQLTIPFDLSMNNGDTDSTTVHTELDVVYLRIPYQATLTSGTTSTYTLDSIIGDTTKAFHLNVYESASYLDNLNPQNPTTSNSYFSDHIYDKSGTALNEVVDYPFKPNAKDTVLYIDRTLKSGETFKDSINIENNIPFARIKLKRDTFLTFMEKFDEAEFASQAAFNVYFKGIILEATGEEGSLMSLSFSGTNQPSIDMYYTNTITLDRTNEVYDTIVSSKSFKLGSITNSIYSMGAYPTLSDEQTILQGTAGSEATIAFFNDDIANLVDKNWLINDAKLEFYVDQNVVGYDTIATPFNLYLYKDTTPKPTQIKDIFQDGGVQYDGGLEYDSDGKPYKYSFGITDYISDILTGEVSDNPPLGIRVLNTATDFPTSFNDTLVEFYNWNPKAVTILNEKSSVSEKRAQLKISYSIKKE